MSEQDTLRLLHQACQHAPNLYKVFFSHPKQSIKDAAWDIFHAYTEEVIDDDQLLDMERIYSEAETWFKRQLPFSAPSRHQERAFQSVTKMEAYQRIGLLLPAYGNGVLITEEVLDTVGYSGRSMFRP
jgi:hypothetical protein